MSAAEELGTAWVDHPLRKTRTIGVDAIGTSAFVGGDSEAEAMRLAEALPKFEGQNPEATRAWRSTDRTGWHVTVVIDRGPGWDAPAPGWAGATSVHERTGGPDYPDDDPPRKAEPGGRL